MVEGGGNFGLPGILHLLPTLVEYVAPHVSFGTFEYRKHAPPFFDFINCQVVHLLDSLHWKQQSEALLTMETVALDSPKTSTPVMLQFPKLHVNGVTGTK